MHNKDRFKRGSTDKKTIINPKPVVQVLKPVVEVFKPVEDAEHYFSCSIEFISTGTVLAKTESFDEIECVENARHISALINASVGMDIDEVSLAIKTQRLAKKIAGELMFDVNHDFTKEQRMHNIIDKITKGIFGKKG